MSVEVLQAIGDLFITFLSTAGSITAMFYISSWVLHLILSMVFPSRYGD